MDFEALKSSAFSLANPDLFRTLIGAAFGTFAGAWIASRSQTKKTIIAEFNAIAKADMLAIQIANTCMALKRQHVQPVYEGHLQIIRDFEAYKKSRATGGAQVAFSYSAELKTLSPMKMPIEALEKLLLEQVSIRGRGLAAAVELATTVDVLRMVIEGRNALIEELKGIQNRTERQKLEMLIGLRTASGVIDNRFTNITEAMFLKTNDCIFFARILSNDLHKYGAKLFKRYRWRFRLKGLMAEAADWSPGISSGLLPDEADYQGWLRGFQQKPSRWHRFVSWCRKELGSSS
jgi:hypothetical protein